MLWADPIRQGNYAYGVRIPECDIETALIRRQRETGRREAWQPMRLHRRQQDRFGDRVGGRTDYGDGLAVGVRHIQLALALIQQQRDGCEPVGIAAPTFGLLGSLQSTTRTSASRWLVT